MKKNSYEILNDGFLNLYEDTLFVRCFEYSAVLLGEITGYRVFLNIDKKTGFIFLELGFPKIKLKEIVTALENKGYNLRIIKKDGNIDSTFGSIKLEKNKEKIKEYKKDLIKF